jgi:heavy metal translocating P-type ATPase
MRPPTICAHCGLGLRGSGTTLDFHGEEKHFCCSGCAFVYQLAGGGEEGDSSESWFLVLLAIGVVLSGFIMTFAWVLYLYPDLPVHLRNQLQYILLVLTTPVIFGLGYPYMKLAALELARARLSMATLIALGTVTAYVYSARQTFRHGHDVYFDTASMVIVLVTLGRYLQARARARMAQAMRILASEKPAQVRRLTGSEEEVIALEEVCAGDLLRALPAEKIAVDGRIVDGCTTVDESILTGESLPVPRGPGENVLQGTVNLDGTIIYQAVQVGEGTLRAQIERMCAEAIGSRMPLQALVDRVSAWFVGAVVVFALSVAAYYSFVRQDSLHGFLNALAILVVACPCALGIATPMATFVALQRAAKEGVLIRAPEVLEHMSKINTIVFDKTGTLTEGKLRVLGVIASANAGVTRNDVLQIAASLESNSEHHLARAILEEFKATGGQLLPVRDFQNHPGEGIEGIIESSALPGAPESAPIAHVHLGTAASLQKLGFTMPPDLEASLPEAGLESRVYLGWNGAIRGVVRLQDHLRPGAASVMDQCRAQGIEVHLLSGDRTASTQQVAAALGIQHWAAERLPWQKVEYVESLQRQGRKVAMVGDGVNDAPALATADVGMAHQIGTDLSKEAADVHILAGDITLVPWVLSLSKKTFRHIQGNLFWAFIYNIIAIGLAAAGWLRPVMAAAAMLLSSLMVVGNSLRLEKVRGLRGKSVPRVASPANPLPSTEASPATTNRPEASTI